MTAKEFAEKYFGDPRTAEPYQQDLTVDWVGDPATAPNQRTSNGIPPRLCATDEAAADLASLLTDLGTVTVFEDFPQRGWPTGNQFTQSGKVPWITVTKDGFSATENAGEMIAFFSHGYPADTAAEWMRNQFTMDLAAQAKAQAT